VGPCEQDNKFRI